MFYAFIVGTIFAVGSTPALNDLQIIPVKDAEKIQAIVYGYSSEISQTDDTPEIMASGETVYRGAIACPARLSFGTKVVVENKIFTCEDRMHKRYQDKEVYDIWYPDKKSAITHGKKNLTIYILNELSFVSQSGRGA